MTPQQQAEQIVKEWYEKIANADDFSQEAQQKLLTTAITTALTQRERETAEKITRMLCVHCDENTPSVYDATGFGQGGPAGYYHKRENVEPRYWAYCPATFIRQRFGGTG